MPFWQTAGNATTSSSSSSSSATNSSSTSSSSMNSTAHQNRAGGDPNQNHGELPGEERTPPTVSAATAVSLVAKSLLPTRRRLKLDPASKLYFPYEPGKQAKSAIGIKNICKSHIAFKFQTTAPKSCYMRPPGAILAPGESLIATVFKFVEPPENNIERQLDLKNKVKFKIMSLKVKGEMEYVPELVRNICQSMFCSFSSSMDVKTKIICSITVTKFDDMKNQAAVEQILRVVFLDPESTNPVSNPKMKRSTCSLNIERMQLSESEDIDTLLVYKSKALQKLKRQLAEAEAELENRKKPAEEPAPRPTGEGLIIDEWKERRERYLAQQQVEVGPV
ncbi:unnamed protein product [Linum tenue]|uniref:MSP domain-containing protein n=1 Tax=Linum tenue TaxID=586396 RepID=A0AAV0NR61_9ROSI|nr:unnamed protein product [Linum tenue]